MNIGKVIRHQVLKIADADYTKLDEFLHSISGVIVEDICRQAFDRKKPGSHLEERVWLEEFYRIAQHRGSKVSGWKLRMLIYYWMGKITGEW